MLPKILHWLGMLACILLVAACFMPWGYYADVKETFTGFYSYNNNYGKPGKFLTILAVIALLLMWLPKVWAKRTNLFVCAMAVGYALKSYVLYTSCYNAYCPDKKIGVYLMMSMTIVMLVSSAFPDLPLATPPPTATEPAAEATSEA